MDGVPERENSDKDFEFVGKHKFNSLLPSLKLFALIE